MLRTHGTPAKVSALYGYFQKLTKQTLHRPSAEGILNPIRICNESLSYLLTAESLGTRLIRRLADSRTLRYAYIATPLFKQVTVGFRSRALRRRISVPLGPFRLPYVTSSGEEDESQAAAEGICSQYLKLLVHILRSLFSETQHF